MYKQRISILIEVETKKKDISKELDYMVDDLVDASQSFDGRLKLRTSMIDADFETDRIPERHQVKVEYTFDIESTVARGELEAILTDIHYEGKVASTMESLVKRCLSEDDEATVALTRAILNDEDKQE